MVVKRVWIQGLPFQRRAFSFSYESSRGAAPVTAHSKANPRAQASAARASGRTAVDKTVYAWKYSPVSFILLVPLRDEQIKSLPDSAGGRKFRPAGFSEAAGALRRKDRSRDCGGELRRAGASGCCFRKRCRPGSPGRPAGIARGHQSTLAKGPTQLASGRPAQGSARCGILNLPGGPPLAHPGHPAAACLGV